MINRHLYASGLKGPIPDEVARLENLTELLLTTINRLAKGPLKLD